MAMSADDDTPEDNLRCLLACLKSSRQQGVMVHSLSGQRFNTMLLTLPVGKAMGIS